MLKPLGDRIVVKVIEDTEQTSGGIFIPDSAKEKPQKGEVVAVGEGKLNDKGEREPMDVKAGDTILYAKYYHETLSSKYGNKGKIRRDHLSQIISYVMNQEDDKLSYTKETSGILVYPTINKDINVSYSYKNTYHTIRICTINLNQDWQNIEKQLKEIICR